MSNEIDKWKKTTKGVTKKKEKKTIKVTEQRQGILESNSHGAHLERQHDEHKHLIFHCSLLSVWFINRSKFSQICNQMCGHLSYVSLWSMSLLNCKKKKRILL